MGSNKFIYSGYFIEDVKFRFMLLNAFDLH